MKVNKLSPRGYCHGVVDAMLLAQNAALDKSLPRPIYILGMLVHNQHVTEAFKEHGIISLEGENRLELLDQVNTGTVIFTAHGVSNEVRKKAQEKGLVVIDATCRDVTRTHLLIDDKVKEGYDVLYIGKKGHPEPEGAMGVSPEHVHLISNEEDINNLNIDVDKIIITNQTTMSKWDVEGLVKMIKEKIPQAEVYNELCDATQTRQEAVALQARGNDLLIVVGDPKSNNSNRLAQVSEEIAKVPAYRIADLSELDIEWLKGKNSIAVTSGASTPTNITKEVIEFIEQFDENDPQTWEISSKIELSKILPKLRNKED